MSRWRSRTTSEAVRGDGETEAWRNDGQQLFDLLQVYTMCMQSRDKAITGEPGDLLVRDVDAAERRVHQAHDEFYNALQRYITSHAPGVKTGGRGDPSRGGFAALSQSIQDAYRAVTLGYLVLIGLAFHGEQIAADGRLHEVEAAGEAASPWYNAAGEIVVSLLKTGEPRGARFITAYTDLVHRPNQSAFLAYQRLQPYLSALDKRQRYAIGRAPGPQGRGHAPCHDACGGISSCTPCAQMRQSAGRGRSCVCRRAASATIQSG